MFNWTIYYIILCLIFALLLYVWNAYVYQYKIISYHTYIKNIHYNIFSPSKKISVKYIFNAKNKIKTQKTYVCIYIYIYM